jgi:RimJ/RimL family protein N-acetyltransferase
MKATLKPASKLAPLRGLDMRRTKPEDREALVDFYRRFEPKGASLGLPPHKEPERWLAMLAPFPNFLISSNGEIVAHAVLCPEGDAGEVAVFVGEEYRGRGLGRCLLSELVDEARRLGLARVWGLTELDNIPMRRLARSLGFHAAEDPYEFTLDLEVAAARPRAA